MAEGEPPDSSPPIDDPSPTSVVDEKNADRLCQALRGRTVAGVLPP
ncbi:hypothetical protein ACFWN5_21635 [Streptomyces sp. NPDC058430]